MTGETNSDAFVVDGPIIINASRHPRRRCVAIPMRSVFPTILIFAALLTGAVPSVSLAGQDRGGEQVYRFYCYQCHGYDGQARTLAARSLDPAPRDFVAADPAVLNRARMKDAVRNGRPGTGMVGFSAVLTAAEIERVVDYIRDEFMQSRKPSGRYHTPENGWVDHRERYREAYPFVLGNIPLDRPASQLPAAERRGRSMYFEACISCHDLPMNGESGPLRMDARPVSFPRGDYDHREPDAISQASYYAPHDAVPALPENASEPLRRGQRLYLENCAFCHGNNATGRNWIGEFIEPKAANLAESTVVHQSSRQALIALIRIGIEGTSMPAWRWTLSDEQIGAIADYLRALPGLAEPASDGRAAGP